MKLHKGFTLLEVLFAAALLMAIAYLIASIQTRVTARLWWLEKTTHQTFAAMLPLCNNAALATVQEQKLARKQSTDKEQDALPLWSKPREKTTLAKVGPSLRIARATATEDALTLAINLPFPAPPA